MLGILWLTNAVIRLSLMVSLALIALSPESKQSFTAFEKTEVKASEKELVLTQSLHPHLKLCCENCITLRECREHKSNRLLLNAVDYWCAVVIDFNKLKNLYFIVLIAVVCEERSYLLNYIPSPPVCSIRWWDIEPSRPVTLFSSFQHVFQKFSTVGSRKLCILVSLLRPQNQTLKIEVL